jgi:hypothetical protein
MSNNVHAALRKLNSRLKAVIPPPLNVSREIANLLKISREGAYRRLRGESNFILSELIAIKKAYGISLDELTTKGDVASFSTISLFNEKDHFPLYLDDIAARFNKLSKTKKNHTFNVCNDLPFFRQMAYQYLIDFKLFFWCSSHLNEDRLSPIKYEASTTPLFMSKKMKEISALYNSYPSTEIWTNSTICSTLSLIEYFDDCGKFKDNITKFSILTDLVKLVVDLDKQARAGCKPLGKNDLSGKFTLYHYGLPFANDSIYLETNGPRYLSLGFNHCNSIQTSDKRVLLEYRQWLDFTLSKSIQISQQAEKARHALYINNVNKILDTAKRVLEPHL